MKHLLLQFAEVPEMPDIDLDLVEYDPVQNLTIVKNSGIPAVNFDHQVTQTFTKTYGEGADSDSDLQYKVKSMMGTSTHTRVLHESTDNDADRAIRVATLAHTATKTFTRTEASDSDNNYKDLSYLTSTRTLTESSEALDSDK